MKKLFGALLICLTLAFCFSACKNGGAKHGAYEKIYDKYNSLTAFEAEAEINVKSNLTSNTYAVKQYYLAPDNYKMEIVSPKNLSGTGYSFTDGRVNLKSAGGEVFSLEDYVPEDRSYVFLNDFFEGYYKSESTACEASGGAGKNKSTVLKNVLSEGNPYRYSQCLWVNNESLLPEKLVTYDMDNNEVITVIYKNFSVDKKIDKSIFKK